MCVTTDGDYVFCQSEIDFIFQGILQIDQRNPLLKAYMGAEDQNCEADVDEEDLGVCPQSSDLQTTAQAT